MLFNIIMSNTVTFLCLLFFHIIPLKEKVQHVELENDYFRAKIKILLHDRFLFMKQMGKEVCE